MEQLGRVPLVPSSRVFRIDNQSDFSSNGDHDHGDDDDCEPIQFVTVSNPYFNNGKASSSLPPHSIRYGYKIQSSSQSQNVRPTQQPRYRTSSYDGKIRLPPSSPRQPRPLYSSYDSDVKLLPSFLLSSIPPSGYSPPTSLILSSYPLPLLFPVHKVSPPSHSKQQRLLSLTLYFSLNLVLTLYNKLLLIRFPFPYTLTALHALSASIGGRVVSSQGQGRMKMRQGQGEVERMVILGFSVLYAVNIAVSNVSLHLVTVPVSVFSVLLDLELI